MQRLMDSRRLFPGSATTSVTHSSANDQYGWWGIVAADTVVHPALAFRRSRSMTSQEPRGAHRVALIRAPEPGASIRAPWAGRLVQDAHLNDGHVGPALSL